jgi:putative nucleotidyltransferase with HDIG domain
MKRIKADRRDSRRAIFSICLLIMAIASAVVPLLLKTNTMVQYKSIYSGYTVGEISEKNVYAKQSIDLINQEATQEAREAARKAVLPVFSFSALDTSAIIARIDNVRTAFAESDYDKLCSLIGESLAIRMMALDNTELLGIAYDVIKDVVQLGYFDSSELVDVRLDGYNEITVSNMYYNSRTFETTVSLDSYTIVSQDSIRDYLSVKLADIIDTMSATEAILLEDILVEITDQNILYDKELTQQRRDAAAESVDTVVISLEKGDVIIAADHVVTHEQMELLKLLSTQSNTLSVLETMGHVLFDFIMIGVGLYVFEMFLGRKNLHFKEFNILLTAAFIITLIATYFLSLLSSRLNLEFSDSFLPVFFLPLFMTEVTGYKRIGFVSVAMIAAIMTTLPSSSSMTFFYCIICGAASVFLIRFYNKRIDIVYQWFFSSITCAGVTIVFMIINEASFTMIFTVLLGTLINVSIAYILLSALLPLAEKIFNLPTIFRLNELAYGESPILTRLSQAAPGTYSHSMAVADLAEVGAKAIGANPLLARVGGMYHDIGKIEHPEYFIENQNGVNKHDDISPSLSVAIIKSHVKVGSDKGREMGLPIEIVKIIGSHHGNDVIAYFYNEALKTQAASNDDKGETVKASDYSYNAEIPDFRECGIVMLADSIEAASRTVTPNASKYAKLIDSIFMGKIERGQLDNSGLTLNDIKTLSESFVKVLVARNHSRIEYPDED